MGALYTCTLVPIPGSWELHNTDHDHCSIDYTVVHVYRCLQYIVRRALKYTVVRILQYTDTCLLFSYTATTKTEETESSSPKETTESEEREGGGFERVGGIDGVVGNGLVEFLGLITQKR